MVRKYSWSTFPWMTRPSLVDLSEPMQWVTSHCRSLLVDREEKVVWNEDITAGAADRQALSSLNSLNRNNTKFLWGVNCHVYFGQRITEKSHCKCTRVFGIANSTFSQLAVYWVLNIYWRGGCTSYIFKQLIIDKTTMNCFKIWSQGKIRWVSNIAPGYSQVDHVD